MTRSRNRYSLGACLGFTTFIACWLAVISLLLRGKAIGNSRLQTVVSLLSIGLFGFTIGWPFGSTTGKTKWAIVTGIVGSLVAYAALLVFVLYIEWPDD